MRDIKFGTDGWRGVIADDFTFENLAKAAQAIADYYKTEAKKGKGIVIGYDTRFLSPEFALRVAEVLLGNEIPVLLSQTDVPTQAISFTVIDKALAGGIMITASHNPYRFNGVKVKSSSGASVAPEVTGKIESFVGKNEVKALPWEEGEKRGLAAKMDLLPAYLNKVSSFLDMELMKKAHLKIVYDSMYGVGYGLLEKLLEKSNCQLINIHPGPNPGFGGINPEPIEENLEELAHQVKAKEAHLGLATDGDADRMGLIDDKGRYLSPLQIFSLLLLYLVEERNMRGKVVKTVSLGYQPERICRKFGLEWEQTLVGFKYIADKMLKEEVFFGGEESGGYGYYGHLPERDGVLSCLLFVEMLTKKGKPLSSILDDMEKKFGKSFFKRVDFEQEGVDKERIVKELTLNPPSALGSVPLKEILTIDGVKFIMEDESWLLIRPSGTEPKVRVYAEAPKVSQLQRIIQEGENLTRAVIDGINSPGG
ncbi:phosphoglucomutase/phosphomannomutase family protein [Candidatus Aerophobetes bacterium]|nr:phosphoglucomutase/phosphomannomutase family protein [Candidatus Aerophobetes bacterium]